MPQGAAPQRTGAPDVPAGFTENSASSISASFLASCDCGHVALRACEQILRIVSRPAPGRMRWAHVDRDILPEDVRAAFFADVKKLNRAVADAKDDEGKKKKIEDKFDCLVSGYNGLVSMDNELTSLESANALE